MITGITGLGASRAAVENKHNSMVNNWMDMLYSCIARAKPFRISVVTDTNSAQYLTDIQGPPSWSQIQWPAEPAYSSGGQLIHQGAITDVDFGSADLEGRVEGSFTFTPKGQPGVVAGTHT